MSVLSNNSWYQFVNDLHGDNSGVTTGCPYPTPGYCSIYVSPFNATKPDDAQLWQFVQTADISSEYIIRARDAGSDSFLGVQSVMSLTSSLEISTPRIQPFLDETTTWTLRTWEDGTFYVYSSAHGSDWRISLQENGSWLWLTSNVTTEDLGLHWSFKSISQINDIAYSTIPINAISTSISTMTSVGMTSATATISTGMADAPPTTTTTPTLPQTTAQPSTTSNIHSGHTGYGLSSYSEAELGAVIGGVALFLIFVFSIYILIRHLLIWRQRTKGNAYDSLGYENDKVPAESSLDVVEAGNSELPELPTTAPRMQLFVDEVHYLMKR